MNNIRQILYVILLTITVTFCFLCQEVQAQKAGTTQPKEDVFNYLFQNPKKWSGAKYLKPIKFMDRVYIKFGAGAEQLWGGPKWDGNGNWGLTTNGLLGIKLAPVHGIELKFGYGELAYDSELHLDGGAGNNILSIRERANFLTFGINYLFNFTSFASRLEEPRRWELMGLVGLNARIDKELSVGPNVGLRGQFNMTKGASIFLETNLSLFDNGYYKASSMRSDYDLSQSVTAGLLVSFGGINNVFTKVGKRASRSSEDGFLSYLFDFSGNYAKWSPYETTVTEKSRVDVAIKTNLLYGLTTSTPNLGVEIGLGLRTTLDISGSYNWFNLQGDKVNNKKLAHWAVQPEFRYFLCERFNGHFFGIHGVYGEYNISNYELPLLFGKGSKDFRYEGSAIGGGLSYGYQLILGRKWNLEFNLGFGYLNMKYNEYDCVTCGDQFGESKTKHYFGPTKAGITLIFML